MCTLGWHCFTLKLKFLKDSCAYSKRCKTYPGFRASHMTIKTRLVVCLFDCVRYLEFAVSAGLLKCLARQPGYCCKTSTMKWYFIKVKFQIAFNYIHNQCRRKCFFFLMLIHLLKEIFGKHC